MPAPPLKEATGRMSDDWFDLDLSAASSIHAMTIDHRPDGAIVLADDRTLDWHLAAITDPRLKDRDVTIELLAEPTGEDAGSLYLNGWGGIDLASVRPSGMILAGAADAVTATRQGDRITITLAWHSAEDRLAFGVSSRAGRARHVGQGRAQWIIHRIRARPAAVAPRAADRLVFVDVGAAGGLDPIWRSHMDRLHCVFVEPGPAAAAQLTQTMGDYTSAQVLPFGLAAADGPRTLYVTAFEQCSSLLEPDAAQLARYSVAPLFEVKERITIDCRRYDTIEGAPAPDCIKIDVQGAEHEVLQGFGRHLNTVLGIELESHFYPIYKGQKLLGDLVALLETYGLRLRRVTPQANFNRDFTEVNAFFTREHPADAAAARKLALIHQVWQLPDHEYGEQLVKIVLG